MIHGSTPFNGFNIMSLQNHQNHAMIKVLLKEFLQDKEWSKITKITSSYLCLETGRLNGILNYKPPVYITQNIWILYLWRLLDSFQGSIQIHNYLKLYIQHEEYMFIIDNSEGMFSSTHTLIHINKCRMYNQASTLSDISTDNGVSIHSGYVAGNRKCKSIF